MHATTDPLRGRGSAANGPSDADDDGPKLLFFILHSTFFIHLEVALLALCGSLVGALETHEGGFEVA